MDKPAHTPGPWSVIHNSWEVSTVYGPDGETIAECPINSIVTEDTQFEHEAVKEANARLIETAPDLLEELEQQADGCSTIISLLSGQQSAVAASLVGMLRFQEVNARAAIAKALGQETTP